jgi:hypothetical protein
MLKINGRATSERASMLGCHSSKRLAKAGSSLECVGRKFEGGIILAAIQRTANTSNPMEADLKDDEQPQVPTTWPTMEAR